MPELPDWNAPVVDADDDEPPVASPEQVSDNPATSPSDGGSDAESQNIGIPQASNFFLPVFGNDYGKPFFERQGMRFRLGPVNLRMSLNLATEYNDNVFASNTDPVASIVEKIGPDFLIGVGDFTDKLQDFFLLEYSPEFSYYQQATERNRINQLLIASGQATFSRFSTKLDASYINADTPDATQSGRSSYQIFQFNWKNSYYLTAKTFLSLGLGVLNQNYENGDLYTTYSASPQIGYQFSPKTTFYLGPSFGIAYTGNSDIGEAADGTQTFQGLNLGFHYTNLRKIQIDGLLGIQSRQFHGANSNGTSNFTTPIFDFTVTYAAREKTDVQMELSRDVQISNLTEGLTYTTTQFQLALDHQLTNRLKFSASAGYEYLEYEDNSPEGRTDNYLVFRPSLTYTFWHDQCAVVLYYRRQQRDSSISFASYTINVYGISFNYDF